MLNKKMIEKYLNQYILLHYDRNNKRERHYRITKHN